MPCFQLKCTSFQEPSFVHEKRQKLLVCYAMSSYLLTQARQTADHRWHSLDPTPQEAHLAADYQHTAAYSNCSDRPFEMLLEVSKNSFPCFYSLSSMIEIETSL